jgi:hypothetical protein
MYSHAFEESLYPRAISHLRTPYSGPIQVFGKANNLVLSITEEVSREVVSYVRTDRITRGGVTSVGGETWTRAEEVI